MTATLDIATLRSLVAIIDTRSFSRAAERLGRSQSAISLQIARLEVLLGYGVIERSRGRVIGPTERGETLVGHARQIIELNDRAVASADRPTSSARVRIGMPADFLERNFPLMLQEIRCRHPAANFEVRSNLSARLIEEVDEGRLDLALFKRSPSSDVGSAIGSEPMRWFRGATASFVARASSPFPLVAFAEGCAYRQESVRSLGQTRRGWYLACEVRSFPALAAAVAAGLGYAALPARLGERNKALVGVHSQGLPKLQPVELAVGIAKGRDAPLIRSVADIIAQHYAVA
jgi:DNA-binding transcriptional LysR family regulator